MSFTIPINWIAESDRFGYTAFSRRGIISGDTVAITIWRLGLSKPDYSLEEGLEREIERENSFFKLDQIERLRPAHRVQVENNAYEMATVTISVPTASIPEGRITNQMGQRTWDVFQVIDIYLIDRNTDTYPVVMVYKGKNSQLNAEADEIVRSIRYIHPPRVD